MNEEVEKLRKTISSLEKRADSLEKRFSQLIGKESEYIPRTNSLMREGLPLEIFSRISLLNSGFKVYGIYPFEYITSKDGLIERSIDIYASKSRTYQVPADSKYRAGESWPEEDHLLVEIKQRKSGVEWIFTSLPTSEEDYSIAGNNVPIVNAGFELRPGDNGLKDSGNPLSIENAISQLNQSYLPFYISLSEKSNNDFPEYMKRFRHKNTHDCIWLLLITNAKLKYFDRPQTFSSIETERDSDNIFFKELPWVVYKSEPSIHLRHHQVETFNKSNYIKNDSKFKFLELMVNHSHEVHIVNYDHLSEFLSLVEDPPRIKNIQVNISIDGKESSKIEI